MTATITELLHALRMLDVKVWAEGDRLRCSARKGILTPALQAELARRKAELLAFLNQARSGSQEVAPPLQRVPRDGPLPASFGQQRLWFLQELDPHSYAYNIPGAVRIHGPLDLPALEQALTAIVQRHETLRTCFQLVDGVLLQVIGEGQPVRLTPVDLTHLSKADQEAQIRKSTSRESRQPFVLSTGPHWRVSLLRLSAEEHILIIIQHHIISDGWSLAVFVKEMGRLYEAFLAGRPSPLPPLSIQYADYAAWQRQWLQGPTLERQLAYWKTYLHAPLPTLDLPTDRLRPQLQTTRGAYAGILVPLPLVNALRALSHTQGATLFMTLLAGFKILLCHYTGQTDLVVGTSNGNRNHLETESLIGFFVNTLALRTDLSGEPTVADVLRRVQRVALDAYDHQDLPFEKLVEDLHPVRDLSRSPVFQVMFILHNTPKESLQLQNLTLSGVECDIGTAKFDLTLSVAELNSGLSAVMEYNTDLFEASTVRRLLAHWQAVLQQMVDDPDRPISDLSLLTSAERKRILSEWNPSETAYAAEASLCEMFASRAQEHRSRTAVAADGTCLTYAELDARSTRFAWRLVQQGVGRGSLVGICARRSPELVVGLLGILKAGAAYVPLDIELPEKRLDFILDDSRIPFLVTSREFAARFDGRPVRLVMLDDEPGAEACSPAPLPRLKFEDTAYLMYTSGSTGQPKAVVVPHRAIANFLKSMQQQPVMESEDVLLAVTAITFDISVLELFLPLVTGARVVLADRESARDPIRLAQRIADEGVTVMQATPATWSMLVASGWQGRNTLRALCGGEALPRDLAEELLARCASVWNLYGPTETAVWSAVERVKAGEAVVPIGRPIQNTQIYLLDADLQPVPVGLRGEVYIGGAGLADGYLRRPGLTAERFLPHPFASRSGERLYRTGDCARYLPSGRIEFLGRLDYQLKLRGFRIEPGEIEAALRRHPNVREAAVVAWQDERTEKRLVAYVVPRSRRSVSISDLRMHLGQQLPPAMQPAAFVVLDSLPLTPHGKINRRALPMPDEQRPELTPPYAAPRDEVERIVHQTWKELLPLAQIGIHDNFFDLGGHSLLLVQMQRRLQESLNCDIAVVDLFRFPTIVAIAAFLRSGRRAGDPA